MAEAILSVESDLGAVELLDRFELIRLGAAEIHAARRHMTGQETWTAFTVVTCHTPAADLLRLADTGRNDMAINTVEHSRPAGYSVIEHFGESSRQPLRTVPIEQGRGSEHKFEADSTDVCVQIR